MGSFSYVSLTQFFVCFFPWPYGWEFVFSFPIQWISQHYAESWGFRRQEDQAPMALGWAHSHSSCGRRWWGAASPLGLAVMKNPSGLAARSSYPHKQSGQGTGLVGEDLMDHCKLLSITVWSSQQSTCAANR